ncbi:c-type cytochrome [Pseudoxanthomonas mexicana]|uniref:c-type cytochrome n=1 Tax=Pseudoxanthomonas mexicana TaxID=128785 RepID=UPI00398B56C4
MKLISLTATLAATLLLAACGGNQDSAPATGETAPAAEAPAQAAPAEAPAAAAAEAAPAVAAADEAGKKVYGATCALCHASGLAGAPMPSDKDAWAARVAQGKDTLYKHAIEGYTGEAGVMPAKGGNPSLSDEDVKAAVDYMLNQS